MNNERLLRGSLEWRVNIKLGARITRRLTVLVVDTSKHHTAATMSLARSGHGCFAVTNLGAGTAPIRHGHFYVALEDHVVDGRKVIFCRSANKNRWAMAVSQLLGE